MRFLLRDEGTLALLQPVDADAEQWLEENVQTKSVWCGATVIEHRYVTPILMGIVEAGGEIGTY